MVTEPEAPIRAGAWVQVHDIVLQPQERTGRIPADTKSVPLESWVKGILVDAEACIGDQVTVVTKCGRQVSGELVEVNPGYHYGFGDAAVEELLHIGDQVRSILKKAQR
ncbi:MAG: 2-amino-4-oxopentanoate thiolase subunit OrtA [Propionibacteriaceae bacterium]